MRAALIHSTGTLWLAGTPGLSQREHPGVEDFRVAGDIEVQTDTLVRAAAAARTDRGNLATALSFGTSRRFATVTEAAVWAAVYDAAQPRAGIVTICAPDTTGTPLVSYYGAVVMPPDRRTDGLTVRLKYDILCGPPVAVTAATATAEIIGTVVAGDTVTIMGEVFTASDAATPFPPLWNKTAAGLAAAVNAASTVASASVAGSVVTLTSDRLGSEGDEITLATSAPAAIDISGANFTGGAGANPHPPIW